MDPEDPSPHMNRLMQFNSSTNMLYINSNVHYNLVPYYPVYQANVSNHTTAEPQLLSTVIGDSLKCLETDFSSPMSIEVPTYPLYQPNPYPPCYDSTNEMPILQPNLPCLETRRIKFEPLRDQHSGSPPREVTPLVPSQRSVLTAAWLQSSRNRENTVERVAGPLKKKMMEFVESDDLDLPKAIATRNIQDRMIKAEGSAASSLQIERLLYTLKRKRREEFRQSNEEAFNELNWNFGSISSITVAEKSPVDNPSDDSS